MRRLGDMAIACGLLAIVSPLMIIIALAIKWESSGPVLDKQLCIAAGGRRFQMLKFRTRVHDSERTTPARAQKYTRVGQLLRYTRVEDLPQLLNALHGHMSIIDRDWRSPSFLM
jgi:lipopolysaccharide/colanic/teichoic acid biosynthesis glycosyltransferase